MKSLAEPQLITQIRKHRKIEDVVFILICFIFIAGLVYFGLSTYKNYGVYFDEESQMLIGQVNLNYITGKNTDLFQFRDRYYGSFFEVFLTIITQGINGKELIYTRHLVVYSFFMLCCVLFLGLATRLFHSRWWGLFSAVCLATTPRILGNAFYNSKDLIFMDFFVFSICTLIFLMDTLLRQDRNLKLVLAILIHGILSAFCLSCRLPGLLIIGFSLIFFLLLLIQSPQYWKKFVLLTTAYCLIVSILTILLWPILWHDPFNEFLAAFRNMSNFPSEIPNLFMGKYYTANNEPLSYLPVWITVTTPPVYIVGFMGGLLIFGTRVAALWIKEKNKSFSKWITHLVNQYEWLVCIGWAIIPVGMVIVLRSTVYDSWRHVLFLFPAFLLVAMYAFIHLMHILKNLTSIKVFQYLISILLGFCVLVDPVAFLAEYPDYGYVYFNALAGTPGKVYKNYELDYWGLSYQKAIDYVISHDPSPNLKLFILNPPGILDVKYLLSPSDKNRITLVDNYGEADYFISNYRTHYKKYTEFNPNWKYYSIVVNENEIMVVYRIK